MLMGAEKGFSLNLLMANGAGKKRCLHHRMSGAVHYIQHDSCQYRGVFQNGVRYVKRRAHSAVFCEAA